MNFWNELGKARATWLALIALVLIVAPACSANRHLVQLQTQVQVMNSEWERRQEKMDRDFALMAQLLQQNVSNAEAAERTLDRATNALSVQSGRSNGERVRRELEALRQSLADVHSQLARAETELEAWRSRQEIESFAEVPDESD